MRYLLIIFLFLIPFYTGAVTGEDVRFDWELGEPTITLDATDACTGAEVARACHFFNVLFSCIGHC